MPVSKLTILILLVLGLVPPRHARALQQPGEAAVRCSSGEGVQGSAALEGEVRDSNSGVRLPGVRVLAVVRDSSAGGPPTVFNTMTGTHGHYRLCGLPAGVPLQVTASLHALSGPPVELVLEEGDSRVLDLGLALTAGSEGRIVGRVLDRATNRPVAAATVQLREEARTALTDGQGRFALRAVPSGPHVLVLRHLGYEEVRETVTVFPARTLEVRVRLSADPVALEPIVVSVLRDRKLELRGFYERRQWGERLGLGTFFTRADIEKRQPGRATDVLRAVPGVRVACVGRGTRSCVIRMTQTAPSLSRRASGGCYTANVYVDGVWVIRADRGPRAGPSLDELVKPADVEAIEVYRGAAELPAEYSGSSGRCGTVVVWTRSAP